MTRSVLAIVLVAACGGDDAHEHADASVGDAATADAATQNKVVEVTCPATPDAEVTTAPSDEAYDPMATTIAVNGVVRFVMPADHNVVPNTVTTTDLGLSVPFNTTKCLRFTAAGTYGFYCGPHGFTGTVTVN